MKVSILDTENGRRKERINCLRREKIAEFKAKKRLEAELERARCICATTAKASQQVEDGNRVDWINKKGSTTRCPNRAMNVTFGEKGGLIGDG